MHLAGFCCSPSPPSMTTTIYVSGDVFLSDESPNTTVTVVMRCRVTLTSIGPSTVLSDLLLRSYFRISKVGMGQAIVRAILGRVWRAYVRGRGVCERDLSGRKSSPEHCRRTGASGLDLQQ